MNQSTVEIWSILKETQKNLKELSVSQKETDQQIKKFSKELSANQKEARQEMKEIRVSQKETDQQIKRFSKKLSDSQKETDKQLKKTDARFNSQWGKLVESLVEGKLEILNERGIEVRQTAQKSLIRKRMAKSRERNLTFWM